MCIAISGWTDKASKCPKINNNVQYYHVIPHHCMKYADSKKTGKYTFQNVFNRMMTRYRDKKFR